MARLLVLFITAFSFTAQAEIWRPFGYELFSDSEKTIIQRLYPVTNSNKALIELLFNEGKFSNCSIRTEMKWDRVLVSLAHLDSQTALRFSVDVKSALVSESYFPSKDHVTYVIVSEQKMQIADVVSLTYFIYFTVKFDGSVSEIKVFTKKNRLLKSSIIPFARSKPSVEPNHAVFCR